MKKIELLLLAIILFGACTVRLYHFEKPIADWHSWRQVDTSSVSRNFVLHGFDILHPTFHDFSKGVSLIDNPTGHRFVEFPIYNMFQAGLFVVFGTFTIEQWGRIVTIFASVSTIVFLYLFVKKYISMRAGFFAAFFFAFLPYTIYYGRTVLPDALMTMFMMGGIYFFDKWVYLHVILRLKTEESHNILQSQRFRMTTLFFLALFFTTAAIAMKPFVLFFTPVFLYIAWRQLGFSLFRKIELWAFFIFSVLPFVLWRLWMQQYPEGIPQSNWLFNGNDIRFKGAFFQWLFGDRVSRLILGYFGLPFVIVGILAKSKKEGLLFFSFLISSFIYMSVIATGNIQHDYYQILIMPTIAIFFAKGIDFIIAQANGLFNRYVTHIVTVVGVAFMFAFSWYLVRDYYGLQHYETVQIGAIADKLLPKDAKVIAPYGGDTTFLYTTGRSGWPVVDRSFPEFIKAGAQYMIFVNPGKPELNFVNYFATVDKGVVDKGVTYIIFDLTKPLPRSFEILRKEKQ